MDCRSGCGACCIAPSISTPFFGMPAGKSAGVACVHLSEDMRCALFGDSRRPALCDAFLPEETLCSDNREDALISLTSMEIASAPGGVIIRSVR